MSARRAAQRLADLTRDGSSIEISAGGHSVKIKDGKIQPEDDMARGDDAPAGATTVAADRLRSFVEPVERLEEDKAAVMNDIKEVYAEAKGEGYDVKTLRQVVKERKKDRAERQEQLSMFDLYWGALGEA